MLKIFKSILLVSFCLVFIAALFILLSLVGSVPEAAATFGACNAVYPDNTTNVSSEPPYIAGSQDKWGGPLIQLTPAEQSINNFNITYSQDPIFTGLSGCNWNESYKTNVNILTCPSNHFITGMEWHASSGGKNYRRTCCSNAADLGLVAGTAWMSPYDYNPVSGGVSADCSVDAEGNSRQGGFMVHLSNDSNPYFNKGRAVCQQFGVFPKDIRATLSCGDLGETYQGRVTCSQGIIKNHGCDLPSNVSYNRSTGLGAVYYANITDTDGNIIGTGVTLDNVLSGSSWRSGMQCTDTLYAGSVNGPAGVGQTASCTISNLNKEENYITFCARAGVEDAGHRGDNCDTVLVTANLPDLVVQEVICPTGCKKEGDYYFAALGADVTLKAFIKNQGRAASAAIGQGNRGVTFSIGSSDIPVVSIGLPALEPTDPDGVTFQHTFSFPASFSSAANKWQNYKICVDPPGRLGGHYYNNKVGDVAESGGKDYTRDNEASNCKTFKVSALLPDLVVHTFDYPPAVPVGAAQNLSVIVMNQGASASGETTVQVERLTTSGWEVVWEVVEGCEFTLPVLGKAGSATAVSETFQCPFTFSSQGVYNFRPVIDGGEKVAEVSETNNRLDSMQVRAAYPNFTVPTLDCYPDPITDENFSCSATIQNIGQAPILEDLAGGIVFSTEELVQPAINCQHSVSGIRFICVPDAGYDTADDKVLCSETHTGTGADNGDVYTVSCPDEAERTCFWNVNMAECPDVFDFLPINHCTATLVASEVEPGAPGQQVDCVPAMAMEQIRVCVDPASANPPTGHILEAIGADNDLSNCKFVDLTFELPDLSMNNVSCPVGECRAGAGEQWLVESEEVFHLTADVRNSSTYATDKAFEVIYYIDHGSGYRVIDSANCHVTVEGGLAGGASWNAPGSCDYSLSLENPAHLGANKIKVCVDPKGSSAFGAVFEMDDSNDDNCFEKPVSLGGPDLLIDSFEVPRYVPLGASFEFHASVKNQELSFRSEQIDAEQKGLVYYIKRGAGAWQEIENCQTTVRIVEPGATWTATQPCRHIISDRAFYTIKACVNHAEVQHETDFTNNCSEEKMVSATIPDFTAYNLQCLPELAHQDETITCKVKVKNQAQEVLNTPAEVKFYYNREGFDKAMTAFPTDIPSVVIGEDWQTVSHTISFPDEGPVFFKFKIDPGSLIQEEKEDNNEVAEAIEVLPAEQFQPDLIIEEGSVKCGYTFSEATADNFTIQLTDKVVCKARVSNIGNTDTTDYFYTTLYTESDYQDLRAVNQGDIILGARPTIELKFPAGFTFSERDLIGGRTQLEVMACADRLNLDAGPGDETGLIGEIKEDNNCALGPIITLMEVFLADLSVQDNSFFCTSRLAGSNNVVAGDGESFYCQVGIVNNGELDVAEVFSIEFIISGPGDSGAEVYRETVTQEFLSTGGALTLPFPNLTVPEAGSYSVRVNIDPEGVVYEHSIDDNEASLSITAVKEDKITATLSVSPDPQETPLYVGDPFTITLQAQDDQGVEWVKLRTIDGFWEREPSYCGPELTADTPCVCDDNNVCTLSKDFSGLNDGVYEFTGYASGYFSDGTSGDREYSNTIAVEVLQQLVSKTIIAKDFDTTQPITDTTVTITVFEENGPQVGEPCETETGSCVFDLPYNQVFTANFSAEGYEEATGHRFTTDSELGIGRYLQKLGTRVYFEVLDANQSPKQGAVVKVFETGKHVRTCEADDGTCYIVFSRNNNPPNLEYTAQAEFEDTLRSQGRAFVPSEVVGTIDLVLEEIPPETLSKVFHIKDSSSQEPIEGASVTVFEGTTEVASCTTAQGPECSPNIAVACCSVKLVQDGDYSANVSADGYESVDGFTFSTRGSTAAYPIAISLNEADRSMLVTFKVVDSGENGGTAGAVVGSAKIEIYNAETSQLLNTRTVGVNSGSISIYLLPGTSYKLKAYHNDYIDCEWGSCDISPSEPGGIVIPSAENNSFTIHLTKIPPFTYSLNRGFNLILARGSQPLTWQEVINSCPEAYKGFYIYSPGGEWELTKQLAPGTTGYILWLGRKPPCTITVTGTETEFSLLIKLKKGTNAFQVPKAAGVGDVRVGDILGDCVIKSDENGLMLEKARVSRKEKAEDVRMGINGTLEEGVNYWIKVKSACALQKR